MLLRSWWLNLGSGPRGTFGSRRQGRGTAHRCTRLAVVPAQARRTLRIDPSHRHARCRRWGRTCTRRCRLCSSSSLRRRCAPRTVSCTLSWKSSPAGWRQGRTAHRTGTPRRPPSLPGLASAGHRRTIGCSQAMHWPRSTGGRAALPASLRSQTAGPAGAACSCVKARRGCVRRLRGRALCRTGGAKWTGGCQSKAGADGRVDPTCSTPADRYCDVVPTVTCADSRKNSVLTPPLVCPGPSPNGQRCSLCNPAAPRSSPANQPLCAAKLGCA
jgi:hypothetical protein